jgi:diadenosine tetraphosphatase ApaH/serine/threonine PP2A family protein phosphatase
MKIAVLSDIHGNMDAFEKVIEDIERCRPDAVYSLGDNIGYGPEPERVIQTLIRLHIPSVLGNHELAAKEPGFLAWFNPAARKSLTMTFDMLSAGSLDFIRGLPTHLIVPPLRFVHGFPPDSSTLYTFQVEPRIKRQVLRELPERICFVGHTHSLEITAFDGNALMDVAFQEGLNNLQPDHKHLINIGSVGQPRDGDTRAKYVIWDSAQNTLDIRCVPYDARAAAAKIIAAGLPELHARRLLG